METSGLIVAEARASGLPLIVRDEGGAADQLVPSAGVTYAAADAGGLVRAIGQLLSGLKAARAVVLRRAGDIISMDEHFAGLTALYGKLAPLRRAA